MYGVRRTMSTATGLLVLHVFYRVASGYVDYVVPTEPLCDDLIPPVRVRQRQESINYYYTLNQWYGERVMRLTILGTEHHQMKGFLIQIRKNNTAYGQFIQKVGAVLIDCPPGVRVRHNIIKFYFYLQAAITQLTSFSQIFWLSLNNPLFFSSFVLSFLPTTFLFYLFV